MPDTTTHITTSGGLFPVAFVETLRELNTRQPGVQPDSFTLPWSEPGRTPAALEETIATAWELLLERWDTLRAGASGDNLATMNISDVRNRWLLPLFQLLDFDPLYQRGDTTLDEAEELRFPLSHRGWDENQPGHPPVLHTVVPAQRLDERAGGGRGPKSKSPHDMVQLYLNLSAPDRWALLSNGIMLRLLRDYHHTFSKGYVQFDLEAIFETRNYGDFRALFRLCHASRFFGREEEADEEEAAEVATTRETEVLPLEQLYRTAQAAGVKVGEDLRGQVREAIEILGNGFLHGRSVSVAPDGRDPSTPLRSAQDDKEKGRSAPDPSPVSNLQSPLFQRLQDDPELARQFYGEILHVIYRILFLLFSEQRGLVPQAGAPLEDLYRTEYSVTALRERAEGLIPQRDDYTDLWQGLQVTFRMVREGAEALGVFGYNGMLFEGDSTEVVTTNGSTNGRLLAGRAVPNSALLQAMRQLTLIERDGVLVRISYADLGVEELGSIYESLLDFTPRVTEGAEEVDGRTIPANTFFLDPRGLERKSTGSYYTHPALVNELIKSALLPVMRDRLARAGLPVVDEEDVGEVTTGLLADYAGLSPDQREVGASALLELNVCDPAAGSGHFLVKANNALAAELARIRSGDEYPTEATLGAARRDALTHCIYAVDLNPMAVELCKVSLWINASVADRPLSFLDHHIKVGNSLVGATPELLKEGIPYDAFALGRAGDDREIAKHFRKVNRQERRDYEQSGGLFQPRFRVVALLETEEDVHDYFQRLEALADVAPNQARERYLEYVTSNSYQRQKLLADFWTAAFFWPMPEGTTWAPTFADFKRLQQEGLEVLPPERLAQVHALAEEHHFFHWHLEFPDVFDEEKPGFSGESPGGNGEVNGNGAAPGDDSQKPGFVGGFDVILGNPPWERIKLQEKEFFANKAPSIANARTASQRRKLVKQLPEADPVLYTAYIHALRFSEALSSFLRESGRYPLSAAGDINTYQIFAGLVRQIVNNTGRVGIVVQSGIATDYYNQDFFANLLEHGELVSFYDFVNTEGIFPGIHRTHPHFCLLTLAGPQMQVTQSELAFWLTNPDHLNVPERKFALSLQEIELINPNTRTLPVFRTRADAELTKKLYEAAPVLVNENSGQNPWDVSFFTMFHMTNDSGLFRDDLATGRLRLYEAKFFHQFNHRWATYEDGELRDTALIEVKAPGFRVTPRYYVPSEEVTEKLCRVWERNWFLSFRDITNTTNERTSIFAITPLTGVSNKAPLLVPHGKTSVNMTALLANLNSMSFDFVVRQKMGGTSLNFYIVEQLPALLPETYSPSLLRFIVPRVLELTYTAWDIKPFADDVWSEADDDLRATIKAQWRANVEATGGGHSHATPPSWLYDALPSPPSDPIPAQPFMWDEVRRAQIRAELDALYAHLYGLDDDELAYILDTFPIVRRKDEEKYGEYRTKRMVLAMFEERPWERGR